MKNFERKILEYLEVLREQDGQPENPNNLPAVRTPPPATVQQASQTNQQQTGQQPQEPQKQLPGYNTKNIQYYATPVLFHTQYPPNSSDWSEEISKKPWFLPMQDGRIGQFLAKLIPGFRINANKRSGAARYSDYQFRVILRGELSADSDIDVRIEPDGKTTATLKNINIPNKVGVKADNKGEALNALKPIEARLDPTIIRDLQKKSVPPEDTNTESEDKPEKPGKNLAVSQAEVKESRSKSVESFFRHDMNLNDDEFRMATAILRQILAWQDQYSKDGFDAQEVVPFDINDKSDLAKLAKVAKKAVESNKNRDDAADEVARHFYDPEATKKGPETQAEWIEDSFELSRYIKSLNEVVFPHSRKIRKAKGEIRRHGVSELTDVEGGHVIEELNSLMLKNWFPSGPEEGIAASSYKTVFRNKLYEFFDVEDVTFRPSQRTLKKTDEGIDISFTGSMVMEVEIWFDCRAGENGDLGRWTFRVFNTADNSKMIAQKKFTTKGIGLTSRIPSRNLPPKQE